MILSGKERFTLPLRIIEPMRKFNWIMHFNNGAWESTPLSDSSVGGSLQHTAIFPAFDITCWINIGERTLSNSPLVQRLRERPADMSCFHLLVHR